MTYWQTWSLLFNALGNFLVTILLVYSVTGASAADKKEEPLPPQTWAFPNGGQLTFALDDGIYFTSKDGRKMKLISGKVKQFPGAEQKFIKDGLYIYKPNETKPKIIFSEVDRKIVFITDTGIIKILPMYYNKVKADAETIIYWCYMYCTVIKNGVDVQHLALSLGYTSPSKLNELKKLY